MNSFYRETRNLVQLVTIGFFSLLFSGQTFAQATANTLANTVPPTFFGMHIHHAESGTPWPTVPIGSWRLWDAYTAWPNLEPEPGKWNFERLDSYVIKAKLTGTSILLPLGLSPTWASARPNEKSGYQPGNAAEPRNIEDWKRYVRTVAERYKGKIQDYEIWNEVDVPGFYSGSVDIMVTLTREAYQILKDVDPKNRLISPSMVGSSTNVARRFDEFLQKGGGQYIDVIGYHFYVPKGRPELMIPLIDQVRNIMRTHGVGDKPLWNTETGWLIRNDEQEFVSGTYDKTWMILDYEQASAYLARALITSWISGVGRFYWYAWDNGVMGLIEPKSKRDKTAARAYATTVRWLEGANNIDCAKQSEAGVWICNMIGKDGTDSHLVWTELDSKIIFNVPSDWKVKNVETLDGIKRDIQLTGMNTLEISGSPLCLN